MIGSVKQNCYTTPRFTTTLTYNETLMKNIRSPKVVVLFLFMALSVTGCSLSPSAQTTMTNTATNTLSAIDQTPQPTESGCPQEGHIKSPSSFDKATVTFDNETAGDLKVYWIDFNGKRKFYSDLKAHSKYDQATWIGHVWVVANGSDQCVKLESANAVEQTLAID